jgi:hypothetical protein
MNSNNNEIINLNEIVQRWEVVENGGKALKRSRDICDRDETKKEMFMEYEKMAGVSIYPEDMLELDERLILDPLEKPKLERQENTTYPEEIIKIKKLFEVLMKPLDDEMFIPNAELEQLDEDLEAAYARPYQNGERPTRENGAHEEEEITLYVKEEDYEEEITLYVKEDDYECVKEDSYLIKKYKEILNISESEAFELLRRCHYCGTAEMNFGESYCSAKCQEYHFDFDYPCYWNKERCENNDASNCKMCNYKNTSYCPEVSGK